ncbi:GMC oxidoreductase-domain-containing protein [Mycena metata]|uniref:GMC oxidoreductase-domain-containing protein n=1 Tax=Mycena metata TaxID=1033252 RepID=A0AAD7I392_9AGAR|nr:GMC oxidoreductase-domain-containing protein [Mycena metata]
MIPTDYDIIFAGGGTTACVVAGRLAAADNTLRILAYEPLHVQPGRYLFDLRAPGPDVFTVHHANPSAPLGGRILRVSSASCVGGGSSVNAMMYNRAPASDYDAWMHAGNPGWGAADLIPLAKEVETYQAGVVDSMHGSCGPIKVSYGGYETKVGRDFLVAAAGFPRGRHFTEDLNDFVTCDVYGRLPKYIDAETGRRSDAAHFYLYPQIHNPNLHIITEARANRVIFNGTRAVGIEYYANGTLHTAAAARLVVISAGAFCSPAILERQVKVFSPHPRSRSGIGAKHLLEKHGVQVVSDLPGVGQNYGGRMKLHWLPWLWMKTEVRYLIVHSITFIFCAAFEAEWKTNGRGLLATNGIDAGIKLRPNGQDLEQLGPAFTKRWETLLADAPDRYVALESYENSTGRSSRDIQRSVLHGACRSDNHFNTGPTRCRCTLSTGFVHICSVDAHTPLEITTALLESEEDIVLLRWAYKWSRELARRMDCYRGEHAAGHPAFGADSQALCREAEGPVDINAPEILYSMADDTAIDSFHRANVALIFHPMGTCAMKPREAFGVVDPSLNVYGVQNLKVADMSIAPSNVGANTYNTALIIGEKAASIIAAELGIRDVSRRWYNCRV